MKIKYLFGPKAGTIEHTSNNDPTTHALIKAGFAEAVTEPKPAAPAPPKEPRFSVGQMPNGGFGIICQMPSGETNFYNGEVEGAERGFMVYRWNPATQARDWQGPVPPAEVIADYKRIKHQEWVDAQALDKVRASGGTTQR